MPIKDNTDPLLTDNINQYLEQKKVLKENRPFLKGLKAYENPYNRRFSKDSNYQSPGGKWTMFDSELDNPNDTTADEITNIRSERQPWITKALAFPLRTSTKAIAEIAKMPGMFGGVVVGALGQIDDAQTGEDNTDFMQTAFNNPWINAVEEGYEAFNEAVLPVYVDTAVRDGKLVDKIFDMDFWATEGADGLGYVVAMLAPGQAIKALNLGAKAFRPIAAAGGFGEKVTKIGTSLAKLGAPTTPKMFDLWAQTLANTLFESGAEAKAAMDAFVSSPEYQRLLEELPALEEKYYQQLLLDYEVNGLELPTEYDAEGNPLPPRIPTKEDMLAQLKEQAKEKAQKEIDGRVSKLGGQVFGANTAILVGPNAIVSKMLWGGAKNTAKQAGKYVGLKQFGKDLTYAGVREGLWEEGAQSTTEQFFTKYDNIDKSLGEFSGDFVKSYGEMFGTVEGQTAMFLGAVYGGGMQVYMGQKQLRQDSKAKNRLIAAGDNAMTNLFTFYDTDVQAVDENGQKMFQKDKDGNLKPIPDLVKLRKKLESGRKLEILGAQFDLAEMNNDKDAADTFKNIVYTHVLKPYLINDEMGPSVLREKLQTSAKLDGIAAKTAAAKMANELEPGQEPSTDILNEEKTKIINEIVQKAKDLKKVYQSFQEYAPRVFDFSTVEATNEELDVFMNEMSMQYVDHHSERDFAKQKLKEKQESLRNLLALQNKTEEELTDNEVDERLNVLRSDIKGLTNVVKEQQANIDAYWNKNGQTLKDAFRKKQAEAKKARELEEKYQQELTTKIEEIQSATSVKQLKKIKGIGVEALDAAIEAAKTERKAELKEEKAAAAKESKKKSSVSKSKKDEKDTQAAEDLEYYDNNINVGEKITIPESFGTKFTGQTATITKKGKKSISLETENGDMLAISRETIFGAISDVATPYSVEGNIETYDEVQEEETAEGKKENPTDTFIMSTDANNNYEALPWVDPKVVEFERDPRDKTGEVYNVELNDPTDQVDNQAAEEVDELSKEVEELEGLIEYANDNKSRTNKKQKPVKEEVKEVVKKVVEKENITEEEAKEVADQVDELADQLEKEGAMTPEIQELLDLRNKRKETVDKLNKLLDERAKLDKSSAYVAAAKEMLSEIMVLPAKFLNRMSRGVKSIVKRINKTLRRLFLGITLITALTSGVRSDAGNNFLKEYVSEDIANVTQMTPSEIAGLVPNAVDKLLGIGTYAETQSNLDNLFDEDAPGPAIYPQLEQIEEAPVVEKKFLANPINIANTVYKRGNKEVKPWVMDLDSEAVKIELAVNTRSGAKARNYSNALGIIGATHKQFQPQSKRKISHKQFPVSLTYNPTTKKIMFKKNGDISTGDKILELGLGNFQPVSALNITPNDKGGYTIKTAKDTENGTTIISSKRNGGKFHMGLASGGYKGKTIESNKLDSYRNLRGGMFIFTDAEASINIAISGSPNDVFRTLRKLEEKYPDKDLYIFRGDTGTYSTSQFSTNGKVTAKDIQFYSAKNTWGSNQFWVMKKPTPESQQTANETRNTSPEPEQSLPFILSGLGLLAFRRKFENNEKFTQEEIDELKDKLKDSKKKLKERKKFVAKNPVENMPRNVQKALKLWKAGKRKDVEFFIKYLPLNVQLTDGISAPISTLSDNDVANKPGPSGMSYNQIFNNTAKQIREAIIKEAVLNDTPLNKIRVKVVGQKGGDLMIADKVDGKVAENNIKDLYQFQGELDNITSDLFYIVNDKGELINGKGNIIFANRPLAPGEVYLMIKAANGSNFPLKLNIRKTTPEEAEILYELYKYRFDDVAEGKSVRINQTTDELAKLVEDKFATQLAVIGKPFKDVTIKDVVDFFIWDGTEHPESQVRFATQEKLKVAGATYTKEEFNSEEAKAEFIEVITEKKRHHIRFRPRKGDGKYTKTLQDREYINYVVGNKILNTNAVVNEPTFQGETRLYLASDGVMVGKKLSKYNTGLPKTFSNRLRGTNKQLQKKFPALFDNVLRLTKDGRHYVDQKGNKHNRASDLKNKGKRIDFNAKNVFNAAKRGDVVDELVRLYFTFPIKKSVFLKKGQALSAKIDAKRGGDPLVFSDEYFDGLYNILDEYAAEFDKRQYTIYPSVPSFGAEIGTKGLYGGTIDLLAFDNKNKQYILIDVKTTSTNRGDYYTGKEEDNYGYVEQDRIQLNAYRELIRKKAKIKIAKMFILPLTSKSEDKGVNSIYDEIGKDPNEMFLEVDMSKDIYKLRNIRKTTKNFSKRVDMAQAMRERDDVANESDGRQDNEQALPGAKNSIDWEAAGFDLSAMQGKTKSTPKKKTQKKKAQPKKAKPGVFKLSPSDSKLLQKQVEEGVSGMELVYKKTQYVYFPDGHFFLDTDNKRIVLDMKEIQGIVNNHNRQIPPGMRDQFGLNEANITKTWNKRFNTPETVEPVTSKIEEAFTEAEDTLGLNDMSEEQLEAAKTALVRNFRKVDPKGFVKLLRDNSSKPIDEQVDALVNYLVARKVSKDDIKKKCGIG